MPLTVRLHVYDLSQGLAKQLSPVLLGRQLDGVWHTGVVVDDGKTAIECYFGAGVSFSSAGQTRFGKPDQVLPLGTTHLSLADVRALVADLARTTYTPSAYRLLGKAGGGLNCNDFSDELATMLTGTGIPPSITSLPVDVLSTPFGAAIAPMLGGMEAALGGAAEPGQVTDALEVAAGGAAVADAPAAAMEAAASPRAAAALAAEEAAPSLAAAEAAVGSAVSTDPAAARAAFEALVRKEFDAALAAGAASPNEAARVALERAAAAVRAKG